MYWCSDPLSGESVRFKVSDLMMESERRWNDEPICAKFNDNDAQLILQIPLSYRVKKDILA